MKIIHLENKAIDFKRWDYAISQSQNQLTYAFSWYLNVVSPAWEALVTADYEYIMPSVVKFMQIHVKNLEKDRLSISLSGLKFYNKSGYNGKVLLLNKEKIASNADSPDKIRKVYPGSFKLLSITEIQEEVAANESNMLFLFHVGPPQNAGAGKCFEMIFDTEGNLYYYNYRKITNDNTDGFNLNDFKKIR